MTLAELAFYKTKEEMEQDLKDAGLFVKRMNIQRAELAKKKKEHIDHDAKKQAKVDEKKQ